MLKNITLFCLSCVFIVGLAPRAMSQGLVIVTDIAASQSITQNILGDKGTVTALITGASDPHHFALKPSQATTLQSADMIIWVGSDLSPSLGKSFDALAPNAPTLNLSQSAEHHDHHGHNEAHDPHIWLNPEDVMEWIDPITDGLAARAPEHATFFKSNARQLKDELTLLAEEARAAITPLLPISPIVSHDAFRHFDEFAGTTTAGAIADSANRVSGPRSLKSLETTLLQNPPDCLLEDPTEPSAFARELAQRLEIKTISLSPTGFGIDHGPAFYKTHIRQVTSAYIACKAHP